MALNQIFNITRRRRKKNTDFSVYLSNIITENTISKNDLNISLGDKLINSLVLNENMATSCITYSDLKATRFILFTFHSGEMKSYFLQNLINAFITLE